MADQVLPPFKNRAEEIVRTNWGGTALVVVALLALGPGCGSSEEETLTKAEFVKQGSAICQKGGEKKDKQLRAALAVQNESGVPPQFTQKSKEALVSTVILPPYREMSEELAALGIPEEGSAQAEEIVQKLESAIAQLENDPGSALRVNNPFTEFNKLAVDYGMNSCGGI